MVPAQASLSSPFLSPLVSFPSLSAVLARHVRYPFGSWIGLTHVEMHEYLPARIKAASRLHSQALVRTTIEIDEFKSELQSLSAPFIHVVAHVSLLTFASQALVCHKRLGTPEACISLRGVKWPYWQNIVQIGASRNAIIAEVRSMHMGPAVLHSLGKPGGDWLLGIGGGEHELMSSRRFADGFR
jgi:hypothetical protein